MNLGATEIIIIVLVIVLLFGAKKIPDVLKGVGEGIREMKKAARVVKEETNSLKEDADIIINNNDKETKETKDV